MIFQKQYTTFLKAHQVCRQIFSLVLFLSVTSAALFCAGDRFGRGTKAIAMGNAYSAVADEVWAMYYNPAGLADLSSFQWGVFFVPKQFGMEELRTISTAITFPVSLFSLGVGCERFGYELYNETTICGGIAASLAPHISAGLSATYYHIRIERYGQTSLCTFDLGLLAHVNENVSLGFAARNITATRIGSGKEKLPQVYTLGAAYRFTTGGTVSVEMEKDMLYPMMIKGGLEQKIFTMVVLRCGITSQPNIFSVGCAITALGCSFGYAGYKHSYLGWTDQIELLLCF